MAALVQGYPQQSATTTMLQGRPASASGMIQASQPQQALQYGHTSQKRHSIHGLPGGNGAPTVYRGGSGPIQPYAFTATPSLNQGVSWQQPGGYRTNSSSSVPTIQSLEQHQAAGMRPRYSASASMTNLPTTASIHLQSALASRDDSSLPGPGNRRPTLPRLSQSSQSSGTSSQSSQTSQSSVGSVPAKLSPERYRRTAMRSTDSTNSTQLGGRVPAPPSGTSMMAVGQNYSSRNLSELRGAMPRNLQNRPNSMAGPLSRSAIDDMQLPRGHLQDDIKRVRRRSMPALDSAGVLNPLTPPEAKQSGEPARQEQSTRPKSADTERISGRIVNNLSIDGSIYVADTRVLNSDTRPSPRSAGSSSRPSSVSFCPSASKLHQCVVKSHASRWFASILDSLTEGALVRQP